jgi:hypothetical protein
MCCELLRALVRACELSGSLQMTTFGTSDYMFTTVMTTRVVSYDHVTTTRVISYDRVTTTGVVSYDQVTTTRVVSYDQVTTNRVISYDPVMTRLSSVEEVTDNSDNPTDNKWQPKYVYQDWSDNSHQNYSLKRRYFLWVACLAEFVICVQELCAITNFLHCFRGLLISDIDFEPLHHFWLVVFAQSWDPVEVDLILWDSPKGLCNLDEVSGGGYWGHTSIQKYLTCNCSKSIQTHTNVM